MMAESTKRHFTVIQGNSTKTKRTGARRKFKLILGGKSVVGKNHAKASKLTPMLRQYLEIKKKYQDTILLYRIGEFYEMFFSDAEKASKITGLFLTSRNKRNSGYVPMCGVQVNKASGFFAQLRHAGQRVAVCDQSKAAKGLLEHRVIRLIIP